MGSAAATLLEERPDAENAEAGDLAFADTIACDEPAVPSAVVLEQCPTSSRVIPICSSLASGEHSPALETPLWARLRADFHQSRSEIAELWQATSNLDADDSGPRSRASALARVVHVGRRLHALLSFFEWERADILRGAGMGLIVFALVSGVALLAR
jgi:hypothetical protein